jgi:L-serine dehydratase
VISAFELFTIGIGPSSSHTVGPMRAAAAGSARDPVLRADDLVPHRKRSLPDHPNGMRFTAGRRGQPLAERGYYSVGGGFVRGADAAAVPDPTAVRFPFDSARALLEHCARTGLPISAVMLASELGRRDEAWVRAGLLEIWRVMREGVQHGCCGAAAPRDSGVGQSARSLRACW